MTKLKWVSRLFLTTSVTLALTGCATSVYAGDAAKGKDISRVLGGISVEVGAVVGDLDSVNGGIDISDGVIADEVDTVNGSISIGDNVFVSAAETVNGRISAGQRLKVKGSLETVNGNIELKSGSDIGRDLITVNGDIEIHESTIGGDIQTHTGDIDLVGSFVNGDLTIKKNRNNSWFSWGSDNMPVVTIDRTSVVKGTIHLYRKVELRIEEDAKVGEVIRHYSAKES